MFRGTAHIYDLLYEDAGKDYAEESRQVDEQIRNRKPDARHSRTSLVGPAAIYATFAIGTRS